LLNEAVNLSLYFNTPLDQALAMPVSTAQKVFKSRAFDNWKKYQEYEAKTQNAIVERINGVIKGLNVVVKAVAGLRLH